MPALPGGELVCAQILATHALNTADLTVSAAPGAAAEAGLLIDMRTRSGHEAVRAIMADERIVKLIWGADGDAVTLAHPLRPMAGLFLEDFSGHADGERRGLDRNPEGWHRNGLG